MSVHPDEGVQPHLRNPLISRGVQSLSNCLDMIYRKHIERREIWACPGIGLSLADPIIPGYVAFRILIIRPLMSDNARGTPPWHLGTEPQGGTLRRRLVSP
jgi:hypothetical protein